MLWILGIGAALVAWAVVLYNKLIRLKNAGESAWSDIDVQLKRRLRADPEPRRDGEGLRDARARRPSRR